MTDVVKRLRDEASFHGVPDCLEAQAADRIEQLEAEKESLHSVVKVADQTIAEKDDRIAQLESELATTRKDADGVQSESEEAWSLVAEQKARIEQLEADNIKLTGRIGELEAQLSEK